MNMQNTKMTEHEYDCIGFGQIIPKNGEPYNYQSFNLGLDGVLVGCIRGDSRGHKTPGYQVPDIEQASAIRSEIIRRWNAYDGLVAALAEKEGA